MNEELNTQAQHFNQNQITNNMANDMRLISVLAIIYGAINCISIIGAIIGIPMIFAGIRLKESADLFMDYSQFNNVETLNLALSNQARFFRIIKILAIISLILLALSILFTIIVIIVGGAAIFNSANPY